VGVVQLNPTKGLEGIVFPNCFFGIRWLWFNKGGNGFSFFLSPSTFFLVKTLAKESFLGLNLGVFSQWASQTFFSFKTIFLILSGFFKHLELGPFSLFWKGPAKRFLGARERNCFGF